MKKRNIILLIVLLILILIFVYYQIISMQSKQKEINEFNEEFEQYTDKEIFGTNIITVINKAVDYNEKNKIEKDEKGFYIEDNEKSILIELNMLNKEKVVVYKMEAITNFGIEKFLSADFNLVYFKCTDIQYHPNGRISKIVYTQEEK